MRSGFQARMCRFGIYPTRLRPAKHADMSSARPSRQDAQDAASEESTAAQDEAAEAAAQLTALEAARLRGFVDGAEVRDLH